MSGKTVDDIMVFIVTVAGIVIATGLWLLLGIDIYIKIMLR